MTAHQDVSRRRFMKGAASTAVAPVALAGTLARGTARQSPILVAATVVRASHSAQAPQALRIGLRASVAHEGTAPETLVVVVDPVPFGLSSAETSRLIATAVQKRIATVFEQRGLALGPEQIAVQVFGGML